MYQVKIYEGPDDQQGLVIHSHNFGGQKLLSGVIKDEINKIDTFNFSYDDFNRANGRLKPLMTFIKVLDTLKNEYAFEGRILKPRHEMDSDGAVSHSWVSEGELGYLHDSLQQHVEFRGTILEAVQLIIGFHNEYLKEEEYKHFEVGNIEVINNTNNLYFYLSDEQDTFDALKEKILDVLGGELQIRKEDGVRYLDILNEIGEEKETEIKLSKNLISMSVDVDPTEIITRFKPLGTRIESENEEDTDASQARLTIKEVNNGVPYIDRKDLWKDYGIQGGSKIWDDITQASNLITTGTNFINNQKLVLNQYQVNAYDLSVIGLDIDNFKKGNTHKLINPVMNVDEKLRIIGTTKDIINVEESGITIGDKFKSSYAYQSEANRAALRVGELQSELNSVNKKVNEQVRNINERIVTINETLSESDLPALTQAIEDLNDAIVDLNLVVEGIPTYGLATPSQSGLMPMDDKQKVDYLTVSSPTNLNAMRNKLQLITISTDIDLDDVLVQLNDLTDRVEQLEAEE